MGFVWIIHITAAAEGPKHNVPAQMCNNTHEVYLRTQPLSINDYCCIQKYKFPEGKNFWIRVFYKNTSHLHVFFSSNTRDIQIMSTDLQFCFEALNSTYMIQISCRVLCQESKRSDPDTATQTFLVAARSQLSSYRGICSHIHGIFHGTQCFKIKLKH